MNKTIVVCCDGTNNKLAGDLTNVVRLFEVVIKDAQQVAFYDPGVGTMADPAAKGPISKRWSLIKGLAFGAGLEENVLDAYRYLMDVYEDGDKIFLFGFSRGAFTIRVLAGLLHAVGLLHAGTENLYPYIWRNYRAIRQLPKNPTPEEQKAHDEHEKEVAVIRRTFTRKCPVFFLGPWDTVGSVGMYNHNQHYAYSFENPDVYMVRHAVSLDERRAGFRSNVFKADATPLPLPNNPPRVMNVWFPGVHSDIGGGYPWPEESGLAMVAFEWMVREAEWAGLRFDQDKVAALLTQCRPDPCGKIHESLDGAWKLMEYLPARRYDWDKKKTLWRFQPNKERTMVPSQSPSLHRSVQTRQAWDKNYDPASLRKTPGLPFVDTLPPKPATPPNP